MTTGQLNILDPYYAKNDHPTKDDIELLAKAIDIPAQKVKNWFNNRRAKEARLQRNPSDMLSQCFWNMNIDDTDDLSDSDDNDDEHESGDAQGALNQGGLDQEVLYQEARACVATMAEMSPEEVDMLFIEQETHAARACVLAMAKMTPKEVNAAFILNNLKRRIIVHPPQK
ncbi:hypothetical protein DFJ58DRAFT_763174 [Suillus subalutaceus]|uniref:uncharacterized protein n=1 Tax=Suillus subalutaceus TaxID=48586 RepID=UPI001B864124|nr:uncharacterized protein DFJ58DRAFT_763174 [Suillus subalutaceus]KAG1871289.1 hypothetical protein DFJ58DRAFT_763174 [Suillus subalutaceus]